MKKISILLFACFLISVGSLWAQPQILYSVTSDDEVYTANLDGTGTPSSLVANATTAVEGAVGMFPDFTNNLLYIAGGNNSGIWTAPLTGGTSTLLANSTPGDEHFDVYVDVANSRYFYSSDDASGAWVANTNGTGSATQIRSSGDPVGACHGLDYNPATNLVYVTQIRDDRISAINVATGVATTLFDSNDGVDGPRGVNIDPVNGRIYWTQFANSNGPGQIMVANLNGTGTPTVLYTTTSPNLPHGILIDYTTNLLYWAEFVQYTQGSRIMVGNSTGAATPSVLINLPNAQNLRGLEFGQPLQPVQPQVPTLSEWGLILLGLIMLTFGTITVWRRRYAYA